MRQIEEPLLTQVIEVAQANGECPEEFIKFDERGASWKLGTRPTPELIGYLVMAGAWDARD